MTSKKAFYFSHDSNAKQDPKIIKLRIDYGWEGYGIFWALIELLRDQDEYKMQTDYKSIAFELQSYPDLIQSIINDYGLFVVDLQGFFYSESLIERMKLMEDKSKKASESAHARWKKVKEDANAMQPHSESNTNVMQIKENKLKETKVFIEEISVDWIRNEFEKEPIGDLPYFQKLVKAHTLSEKRIRSHFEKWALANEGSLTNLNHCKRSFNKYLESIPREDLDDPNLPSNKHPKSTLKDNWW